MCGPRMDVNRPNNVEACREALAPIPWSHAVGIVAKCADREISRALLSWQIMLRWSAHLSKESRVMQTCILQPSSSLCTVAQVHLRHLCKHAQWYVVYNERNTYYGFKAAESAGVRLSCPCNLDQSAYAHSCDRTASCKQRCCRAAPVCAVLCCTSAVSRHCVPCGVFKTPELSTCGVVFLRPGASSVYLPGGCETAVLQWSRRKQAACAAHSQTCDQHSGPLSAGTCGQDQAAQGIRALCPVRSCSSNSASASGLHQPPNASSAVSYTTPIIGTPQPPSPAVSVTDTVPYVGPCVAAF